MRRNRGSYSGSSDSIWPITSTTNGGITGSRASSGTACSVRSTRGHPVFRAARPCSTLATRRPRRNGIRGSPHSLPARAATATRGASERNSTGLRRRSSLRGPPLLVAPVELFLLLPHLLDEFRVGRGDDDLVELGPVVRNEADALDEDVIDEPLVAALEHPVIDRDLRPLFGRDLRLDGRLVAVDRLPHIGDLLAAVELDLGDVGPLEEIGEELNKLLPLRRRPRGPVARQRALRGLVEVEGVVRDLADRGAPLLGLPVLLQLRVLEDFEHTVDLGPKLIRGLACPRGSRD